MKVRVTNINGFALLEALEPLIPESAQVFRILLNAFPADGESVVVEAEADVRPDAIVENQP